MGSPPTKVDRAALHWYLWKQSDPRLHKVEVHLPEVAEHFNSSYWHMSRILKELEGMGRIKKIKTLMYKVPVFSVRNPAEFDGADPDEGPTVEEPSLF